MVPRPPWNEYLCQKSKESLCGRRSVALRRPLLRTVNQSHWPICPMCFSFDDLAQLSWLWNDQDVPCCFARRPAHRLPKQQGRVHTAPPFGFLYIDGCFPLYHRNKSDKIRAHAGLAPSLSFVRLVYHPKHRKNIAFCDRAICRHAGIGRQASLRRWCPLRMCGFESRCLYHSLSFVFWALSSVGQSGRLITGWSRVRFPERLPMLGQILHLPQHFYSVRKNIV